MLKLKYLMATAMTLAITSSTAGDWHLQLHGISSHDKPRTNGKPWNEKNTGAGLRYQLDDTWGVQAGGYRNSFGRHSNYLMAQFTPLHVGKVHVGAFAGYLDGYSYSKPIGAGLMATWQGDRLSLTARLVPETKWSQVRVLSLEAGLRF
jgi:hypothetical protein